MSVEIAAVRAVQLECHWHGLQVAIVGKRIVQSFDWPAHRQAHDGAPYPIDLSPPEHSEPSGMSNNRHVCDAVCFDLGIIAEVQNICVHELLFLVDGGTKPGGEPISFLVGIASVIRAVSGTGACGKSRPVGDTAGRGAHNAPSGESRQREKEE